MAFRKGLKCISEPAGEERRGWKKMLKMFYQNLEEQTNRNEQNTRRNIGRITKEAEEWKLAWEIEWWKPLP